MGHPFHGIITGLDECRTQIQIFGGIPANRQFGGQQQARAIGIGAVGCGDDFLGIALQITDDEIELRNTQFESHGTGISR